MCLASGAAVAGDCYLRGGVGLDRPVTVTAKRARLMALLEELVAEAQKVLVFSQFVTMLRLVERDIAERGWGYAMLHGVTKARDAQVEAFQSGDRAGYILVRDTAVGAVAVRYRVKNGEGPMSGGRCDEGCFQGLSNR